MKILDLNKWHSQTIESVKHVLSKADAPCVGFSMVFMDFLDKDTVDFKFKTYLAFDPHNPPPEEDRKMLETIFQVQAEQVKAMLDNKGKKQ